MNQKETGIQAVDTGGPGADSAAAVALLDRSSARILLADDNAQVRESTVQALGVQGYQCTAVASGEQCIALLREQTFHVLLLDLSMEGMDGFAVLDELRTLQLELTTIVISGHASFENVRRVFRGGACDFVQKPHTPSQLCHAIDRAVDTLNLQRQLRALNGRLEDSERRYEFIVANSPDLIYLLDNKERFVFVNEKSLELLGFTPQELIGRHFSMLLEHPHDSIPYYTFKERRTGKRSSRNVQLDLQRKDGIDATDDPGPTSITIELNAMGVYQNVDGQSQFMGTYGVARDVTERKKAEETIRFLAYHDLLTRLPNRELFLDRLRLSMALAERNGSKLAVMFLDMDGFKYINDTLGHIVGDSLLQHVAARLKSLLRETDTVSRVGGDEFNVLITDIQSQAEAALVARKIMEAFALPLFVDRHEIGVSFSIGISMYPDDAHTTIELIKHADMAMYDVKTSNKRGYEFFSSNMKSIYQHRLKLEDELRRALEEEQFECYFQPQYQLPDHSFFGLEALIRWRHPERGMVPPGKFIPVAEDIGLIGDIGRYMLHKACGHLRSWIDQGIAPVKIAINVSALQLQDRDFDQQVHRIVDEYALPRGFIALEITESVLMQDMDAVIERLTRLAQLGVDVGIDDFGVGYSSLAYLQRLPIRVLKIDRSFLDPLGAGEHKPGILKGMVALARELELDVVMEGVETQSHMDYVRAAGCDVVQGFFLARPMPAPEMEQRLRQAG